MWVLIRWEVPSQEGQFALYYQQEVHSSKMADLHLKYQWFLKMLQIHNNKPKPSSNRLDQLPTTKLLPKESWTQPWLLNSEWEVVAWLVPGLLSLQMGSCTTVDLKISLRNMTRQLHLLLHILVMPKWSWQSNQPISQNWILEKICLPQEMEELQQPMSCIAILNYTPWRKLELHPR